MKSELLGMDNKYSNNSIAQYQCHEHAKTHLKIAANNINSNKNLIKIGVYGCGPGDNDLIALQTYFIPIITEKNKNMAFEIYMIDIAESKWVRKREKEHNYDNIKIIGITSDIYQKILPENSLDLVISFSCLHWFNKIPFEIINEFSWSCLNDQKKSILRNYLNNLLIQFLTYRKYELIKNGQMILSFDGELNDENHQYQGPTDCLVKVIKNLKLETELKKFFVPTAPRNINNVKNCFQEANIKLTNINIKYIDCPIWNKYILNSNKDIDLSKYCFAEEINKSIQACVSPILKNHLSNDYLELINHEMIQLISNDPKILFSTAGNIIILSCIC